MKIRLLKVENPSESLVISCDKAEGRMTENDRGDIIDSCVIARTNGLIDIYFGYRLVDLADEEEGLFA